MSCPASAPCESWPDVLPSADSGRRVSVLHVCGAWGHPTGGEAREHFLHPLWLWPCMRHSFSVGPFSALQMSLSRSAACSRHQISVVVPNILERTHRRLRENTWPGLSVSSRPRGGHALMSWGRREGEMVFQAQTFARRKDERHASEKYPPRPFPATCVRLAGEYYRDVDPRENMALVTVALARGHVPVCRGTKQDRLWRVIAVFGKGRRLLPSLCRVTSGADLPR